MLEFMMPILNPEKPKRITLTMANTLFEALFEVQLVNWGLLIHETVARAIPYIVRKPSYLSPFIMHLYTYGCTTVEEDDMLLVAAEEVAYKLQAVVQDTARPATAPSWKPSSQFPDAKFPTSLLSSSSSSASGSCRTQPDIG